MKKQKVFWVIVLAVFVISIVCVGAIYNGLVKAEKAVEEAGAQIETVCQRKLDLIPNLVETVKGYVKHEKETLIAVVEARNKAQGVLNEMVQKESLDGGSMVKLNESQSELSGVLKSLFALVEYYPNLRADTNFLALQDQLEGTENRISVARQRYNTSVRLYDTRVATFPRNIVALMFGFEQREDYFEASEEALRAVKVQF